MLTSSPYYSAQHENPLFGTVFRQQPFNILFSSNLFCGRCLVVDLPGPHHDSGDGWRDKQRRGPSINSTEKASCKNAACMTLSHCHLPLSPCALISNALFFTITREHAWPHVPNAVWCLPNCWMWCISESYWPTDFLKEYWHLRSTLTCLLTVKCKGRFRYSWREWITEVQNESCLFCQDTVFFYIILHNCV